MRNEMHSGELAIHQRMGVPEGVTRSMPWSRNCLDAEDRQFLSNISIFAIGTLDAHGQPWASVLAGVPPGFITSPSKTSLIVNSETSTHDPLLDNLYDGLIQDDKRFFAGLGFELSQRWRSKVSGIIEGSQNRLLDSPRFPLRLSITESQGNCPKYINARMVSFCQRTPQLRKKHLSVDGVSLDQSSREHIRNCDTFFIATRHLGTQGGSAGDAESSMDVNHRGGSPGFVRCSDDGSVLYFPEYSGNRIYSTLGNIQTDHVAGVVFPSFLSGDVLYITGTADVVTGAEAETLMPRVKVLVRILVTGFVFVEQGLNVRQLSDVHFSPYNPPVRYLQQELHAMGTAGEVLSMGAVLADANNLYGDIGRYTFTLDAPISYLPGQYVILDFSGSLPRKYAHMNDRHPQLINDDFIRTFTISTAPPLKDGVFAPSKTLECTVKSTRHGVVSTLLRQQITNSTSRDSSTQTLKKKALKISVKGSGGQFTCFDAHGNLTVSRMLWVCAGVGVTPFMAMAEGIEQRRLVAEIVMLFSSRNTEALLAHRFAGKPFISSLSVFVSNASASHERPPEDWAGNDNSVKWFGRRVGEADFRAIENISQYTAFLCGPSAFMIDITQYLLNCNVPLSNIKTESFTY